VTTAHRNRRAGSLPKQELVTRLKAAGAVVDFGATFKPDDDYPDFVAPLACISRQHRWARRNLRQRRSACVCITDRWRPGCADCRLFLRHQGSGRS
jgi:hypothetical protein